MRLLTEDKSGLRPEIQALQAAAVLMVLLAIHDNPDPVVGGIRDTPSCVEKPECASDEHASLTDNPQLIAAEGLDRVGGLDLTHFFVSTEPARQ